MRFRLLLRSSASLLAIAALLLLLFAALFGSPEPWTILHSAPAVSRLAWQQFAALAGLIGLIGWLAALLNALFWRWAYRDFQASAVWRRPGEALAATLSLGLVLNLALLLVARAEPFWPQAFLLPAWIGLRLGLGKAGQDLQLSAILLAAPLLAAPLLLGKIDPLGWLAALIAGEALSRFATTLSPLPLAPAEIRSSDPQQSRAGFRYWPFGWQIVTLMLGFTLLFWWVPELDLAIAGLFLDSSQGAETPWWARRAAERISDPLRPFWGVALAGIPLLLFTLSWLPLFREKRAAWRRASLFIMASSALSVLLVVNAIFKNQAGRPRPEHSDLLLGSRGEDGAWPWAFQKPWSFAGDCISNCSFMSGEASAGFALFAFFLLAFGLNRVSIGLAILTGGSVGLLRIVAGKHYLSDVIFAGLTTLGLVALCFALFYPERLTPYYEPKPHAKRRIRSDGARLNPPD